MMKGLRYDDDDDYRWGSYFIAISKVTVGAYICILPRCAATNLNFSQIFQFFV